MLVETLSKLWDETGLTPIRHAGYRNSEGACLLAVMQAARGDAKERWTEGLAEVYGLPGEGYVAALECGYEGRSIATGQPGYAVGQAVAQAVGVS